LSRGYTLMEVLVTLAIIGIVLATIPILAGGSSPGAEVRTTAIEIASALRRTRSEAIVRFRDKFFYLDVERRIYRSGIDGSDNPIPENVSVSLYTARSELTDEMAGRIRFFPDGSATGGRVTLAAGAHKYVVAVDWLTGVVEVEN